MAIDSPRRVEFAPPVRPGLIVCDSSGRWIAGWRRALECDAPIVETGGLDELRVALARSPASVAAIELTRSNAGAAFDFLLAMRDDFPNARAIVLADRGLDDRLALARELGAIHVVASPRTLRPAAEIVRRRLAEIPPAEAGLVEEIAAQLPWGH